MVNQQLWKMGKRSKRILLKEIEKDLERGGREKEVEAKKRKNNKNQLLSLIILKYLIYMIK